MTCSFEKKFRENVWFLRQPSFVWGIFSPSFEVKYNNGRGLQHLTREHSLRCPNIFQATYTTLFKLDSSVFIEGVKEFIIKY